MIKATIILTRIDDESARRMMKNDNIPAFPCSAFAASDDLIHQEGMTLRDWFAGMALQGILSRREIHSCNNGYYRMVEDCYEIADAMMKARGE